MHNLYISLGYAGNLTVIGEIVFHPASGNFLPLREPPPRAPLPIRVLKFNM